MKKSLLAILCVMVCAFAFVSCSGESIVIDTEAGSYEVDEVAVAGSYEDVTAAEGSTLLLISIETLSADMDDMQSAFYDSLEDGSNVTVSFDSAQDTYPIKSIYYAAHNQGTNPDIRGTLVFEVPSGLQKGSTLTLSGAKFSPVPLTVTSVPSS